MFLICVQTQQNTIKNILDFIENNSVLLGIIMSIITGCLWFKKFIGQRRAEAFFGFYAQLSFRLKTLQKILEENGELNISDSKAGNIYSLLYSEDSIKNFCPSYNKPNDKKMKLYKKVSTELKDILLNTENNVYPRGTNRKEWYENQYIIFSFCEFIENESNQHITNKEYMNDTHTPIHIIKCKLFVKAMRDIQEAINRAKY